MSAEPDMDVGILKIDPAAAGSTDLFRGDCTLDDNEWHPEVSYTLEDETRILGVQQPGDLGNLNVIDLDDIGQNDGNRWRVQLARGHSARSRNRSRYRLERAQPGRARRASAPRGDERRPDHD